ncbi:MAG TPA: hypothetical protein VKD69_11605 [Vicinamibacterales bacterium]|nr:hypothetical protein [Vicinamibacterales bacterium]
MKSALGPFVAAVLLALAGAVFWIAGQTENRLADVHKQLAMLRYADAADEGGTVEESLGFERRVPVVGHAVEADARDVRASAGYWQSDYSAVAPRKDANGVVTETDPGILLLAANAAFRGSQATPDRLNTVRKLDDVVRSYAEVLKAQGKECDVDLRTCEARAIDAAFNYEYAIRTREALARNRAPASPKKDVRVAAKATEDDLPSGPTIHGRPGGPPPATDMNQFKIVIPKRGEERKDAPDAGKGGQKIRKG